MSPLTPRRLTAKDIMHGNVLTVDPEMSVQDVMQLFIDRQITGAPVVEAGGKIVGVVSQTDLMRYQQRGGDAGRVPSYYLQANGEVMVSHLQREPAPQGRVQDIMTPAAFMTEETTAVQEVARFMLHRHVHRILVTRKGSLVGIITSMDLLRALLRGYSSRGSKEKRQRLRAAVGK